MTNQSETQIRKDADYVTEINFFHVHEVNFAKAAELIRGASMKLSSSKGFISVNVLTSTDQTRICSYIQWTSSEELKRAKESIPEFFSQDIRTLLEEGSGIPREYEVYYADDVSPDGVSIISSSYNGTVFINEITTIPGSKQYRLLELVIENNKNQSYNTPGYRSANFHRSLDGERAVNYSLWDTEEHLIEAISSMADQDVNLDETVELASPDFRFYKVFYSSHIN